MSDAVTTNLPIATVDAPLAPPASPAAGLRSVRWAACSLLLLQLIGLLLWSSLIYQRFDLTWDFSIYHQAWYLIAHGHLAPFSSPKGVPFWGNHGEVIIWLLAPLYWLGGHGMTLLVIQDAALVGAEAVALVWLWEIVSRTKHSTRAKQLVLLFVVILLVLDPWPYWAISFDFHAESLGTLLVLAAARDLWRGNRRAWIWVALALACGDVAATYVAGLGIGALLGGRRWRRSGLVLVVLGVGWTLLITHLGGDYGTVAGGYGYLATSLSPVPLNQITLGQIGLGVVHHPAQIPAMLWNRRLDIYANLAPTGFLGLLNPWAAAVPLVVLLVNNLNSYMAFAAPGFQSVPLYLFLPVGTGWVLAKSRLLRNYPPLLWGVSLALILNTAAWAAVWVPALPTSWLRVSSATEAVLVKARHDIPDNAEVIASQGIAGRFSDRKWIYPIMGPGNYPVSTRPVWVVITPYAGIETAQVPTQLAALGRLSRLAGAHLILHGHGVWVFRWSPAKDIRYFAVPAPSAGSVPAWGAHTAAGTKVTAGPAASWRISATGERGYLLYGAYWYEQPGEYEASVQLSSSGPLEVEVWNASANVLLARRSIPATTGRIAVTLPVDAERVVPHGVFHGFGPFATRPVAPPHEDELEVRVWTPGRETADVYSVRLGKGQSAEQPVVSGMEHNNGPEQ